MVDFDRRTKKYIKDIEISEFGKEIKSVTVHRTWSVNENAFRAKVVFRRGLIARLLGRKESVREYRYDRVQCIWVDKDGVQAGPSVRSAIETVVSYMREVV